MDAPLAPFSARRGDSSATPDSGRWEAPAHHDRGPADTGEAPVRGEYPASSEQEWATEQERAEDRGAEAQRDSDLPWLVPEPFGAEPQSGWVETPTPPEGERAGFASPAAADAPVSSQRVRVEIAERLERIAAALRERDGLELGGDASDPLEVLITGYALGYSEGLQRGSRE